MAKEYKFNAYGHNSVYLRNYLNNNYNKRKFNVYFSEPEMGVNDETGILLLVPGFGGNANSNVYKKMRNTFADKYNLVTIQCDYFGWEFMQSSSNVFIPNLDIKEIEKIFTKDEIKDIYNEDKGLNLINFINYGKKYNINLSLKENLDNENLENFNDMSIMQALDNITAVLRVMSIIYDNNLKFNTKKVMIFGQSQGAYISYLCNRFCPGLFTLLIDNSSWLYPQYIENNRVVTSIVDNLTMQIYFDYLIGRMSIDKELIDLKYLYSNIHNQCKVIAFHGVTDNLISSKEKKDFCGEIYNCLYCEIDSSKVDGNIFKSTNHGLNADFLNLFDFIYNRESFDKSNLLEFENKVVINTSSNKYTIDYTNILPIFYIR